MNDIKKWVYTTDELIDYVTSSDFDDYFISIFDKLCKRFDDIFICPILIFRNIDYKNIVKFVSIYKDRKFLITGIDIDNKSITFNLIGGDK